jgi:hypothetical protein
MTLYIIYHIEDICHIDDNGLTSISLSAMRP